MATPVHLSLFGGFAVLVDREEAPALPKKTRALLAFLALQRHRPVNRETVGELLWPDRGTDQMNHSLRQALAHMRGRLNGLDIVVARDRTLALGPAVTTDIDFLAHDGDAAALQRAAAAYTGPLLDGFPSISKDFDDWVAASAARVEAVVLGILERLADHATEAGRAEAALNATERMFAIDPLREDTHRRLLRAFAAAGRRTEALRYYATIVDILRRDLGIAPARETRLLAERLRREMAPTPDDPVAEPDTVPAQAGGAGLPPIAVLPFKQLGEESVPSHLSEGLVADIVGQLAGLRELRVISHGSTLGLKGPEIDARSVGRMLGARYVVSGSMRRAGRGLRLTAELAEADSGVVIWMTTHDADAALSFQEQDLLVTRIVNTLAPQVHQIELRRIRGKRPESLSVYERVLLAREHLMTMDHARFQAAHGLLTEATEAEPFYAEPYALLADYHGLVAAEGLSDNRDADVTAVERFTRRALALDGDNVRALIMYAHRKSLLKRDYDGSRELYRKALEISPNAAQAWLWSSLTYSWVGDTAEALRRGYRALELSPRDRESHTFYSTICTAHYTAGHYREAAEWGMRALNEPAVLRGTYRWTAASLAAMGELEKARDVMREGLQKLPGQTVRDLVRVHPYRDAERRLQLGQHLAAAGLPA